MFWSNCMHFMWKLNYNIEQSYTHLLRYTDILKCLPNNHIARCEEKNPCCKVLSVYRDHLAMQLAIEITYYPIMC